ncbi:hypothetical protein [Spiroplasma endosymbiont of Polydrusus pterygomalis]|uniref:hypothetical protein n=1 Tax=Spiroplasma endosymbiont of Polydrusus pterygomalis TaxID=3139327 RepID=UPI003CCB41F8
MKKIFSMLGAISIILTGTINLFACNENSHFKFLTNFSYITGKINVDKNNNIYTTNINNSDVFKYKNENEEEKIGNTNGPVFSNIIFDKDDNVYFGNVHGEILKYDAKLNQLLIICKMQDIRFRIKSLCIDKNNYIIYYLYDSKVYKYDIKNKIYTEIINYSNTEVNVLTIDKKGNLYIGGWSFVYKYNTILNKEEKINVIGDIDILEVDSNNNVYAGQNSNNYSINKISNDFSSCFSFSPKMTYNHLIIDNKNNVYITNKNKIYKNISESKEEIFNEIFVAKDKIKYFIFGENQKIYFITNNSLFRLIP